jgi:hypothetical protein
MEMEASLVRKGFDSEPETGVQTPDCRLPSLDTATNVLGASIDIYRATQREDYEAAAKIAGTAVATEAAGQLCDLAVPGAGPLCRLGAKALIQKVS